MRAIRISLERNGEMVPVGVIAGDTPATATFAYDDEYLKLDGSIPICLALPLRHEPFSPDETMRYFDGLLPEGFTRRCVAGAARADESDYLSILSSLGAECIGAVMAVESGVPVPETPHYRQLSNEEMLTLASEGATESAQMVVESHVSLAGASGKVGLYQPPAADDWFLPSGTAPSTHIVKQGHVRYGDMVVNEQLCLSAAAKCGLRASASFIIPTTEPLFATARFDRETSQASKTIDGMPAPLRLHQQDFGQALGISSSQKYEPDGDAYLARCFELLRNRSTRPREDVAELWNSVMFSLVVGNLDNHVKNYGLLYSSDWRSLRLAPLYDVVCTLVYSGTSRTLPMSLGGMRNVEDVQRSDVANAARSAGLGVRVALENLDRLVEQVPKALTESAQELADEGLPEALRMADRIIGAFAPRRSKLL